MNWNPKTPKNLGHRQSGATCPILPGLQVLFKKKTAKKQTKKKKQSKKTKNCVILDLAKL